MSARARRLGSFNRLYTVRVMIRVSDFGVRVARLISREKVEKERKKEREREREIITNIAIIFIIMVDYWQHCYYLLHLRVLCGSKASAYTSRLARSCLKLNGPIPNPATPKL